MGVPVWFEWAEGEVRMFAARGSAKLNRLRRGSEGIRAGDEPRR